MLPRSADHTAERSSRRAPLHELADGVRYAAARPVLADLLVTSLVGHPVRLLRDLPAHRGRRLLRRGRQRVRRALGGVGRGGLGVSLLQLGFSAFGLAGPPLGLLADAVGLRRALAMMGVVAAGTVPVSNVRRRRALAARPTVAG